MSRISPAQSAVSVRKATLNRPFICPILNMGHGIGVFDEVEFHLGVLDILFQQALSFQAAPHSLTDQLNQFFLRALVRRLDAPESRLPAVAIDVYASGSDWFMPGSRPQRTMIVRCGYRYLRIQRKLGTIASRANLDWIFES
jgi:hypothetical protein